MAHAGNENVGEAIIVVIADGYAHSVHFDIETRAFGDVAEGSVAIVAVESQRRLLPPVARPIHAINEQNVLPAVGVVIEKGAARPERFGKQLSTVGAGVVLELNPCGCGYVGEAKS